MLAAFVAVWISLPAAAPFPNTCYGLHDAAMRGDEDAVQHFAGRSMLGLGAPIANLEEWHEDLSPCRRRTALMLAAEHGHLSSLKILISSGANVNATADLPELGEALMDARCLAIANGKEAILGVLEKAGAGPRPCEANAWLFNALNSGSLERLALQLRAHPAPATLRAAMLYLVNTRNLLGTCTGRLMDLLIESALEAKLDFGPIYYQAVVSSEVETINRLSAAGARIHGSLELSRAITFNQASSIASLVAAGASTDTADAREAILAAVRDGEGSVIRALLSTGYRGDEETPLLLQAVRYSAGMVPELVKAGVGVEIDDESGATPLMAAASSNELGLVQLLLARGASARTGDIVCETAFDASRAPRDLLRRLGAAPLPSHRPVVPGKAAQRMGVTCGTARLTLTFSDAFEVFLPTGQVPMRAAMEYRVEPGLQKLRVREVATGTERLMPVTLSPGLNALSEKFFSFTRQAPLPVIDSLP